MSDCSVNSTLTLTALGQASTLATCTTFTGSFAIATGLAGALDFDTLEVLTQDLIVLDAPALDSVTAGALRHIGGTLHVENAPALTALQFPALNVLGTLNLTSVGAGLKAVDFPVLETASAVYISDTALENLDGLGSLSNVTGLLKILDNSDLSVIELGLTQIGNGEDSWIEILGNGDGGAAVSFNSLVSAPYISVANATSLDLPVLESSGLTISFNTLTELDLPRYTSSGENVLYVFNNTLLTKISAPLLETVVLETAILEEDIQTGALAIQYNSLLQTIDLPALKTVGGLQLEGNLTNITLPALTNASNYFSISSTQNLSATCSYFSSLKGTVIHGTFTCAYPGQTSSGGSNRSGVIGGAVGGVVAFFVLLGLAVVGVVFWKMRRRGARKQVMWTAEPEGFEMQRPEVGG